MAGAHLQRHAAELAAIDVRNAVMFGQAFVEESIVGFDQVEHAAVLAQNTLEKQLRLLPHRLPQVVVEIRKQAACRD